MMLTGENLAVEIATKLSISQVIVSQDLKWLVKNKLIIDLYPHRNKYKYYRLTDLGKYRLEAYEKSERRQLYGIENARHKVTIQNTLFLENFLKKPEYNFKLNKSFNNVKHYYGLVEGWSVSVFLGKKTTMVITPPPIFANDLIKAHVKANQNMLDYCNVLSKKWSFNLTIPEPTNHTEFTYADEFSKEVLQATGGAPLNIITDTGIIRLNASKPDRIQRIEMSSAEKLIEYVNLPEQVRRLANSLENKEKVDRASFDVFGQALTEHKESFEKFQKMFFNYFQSQDKDAKESAKNQTQLSEDSSRMFG